MKVLIVIHPDQDRRWWCYDVFYKLSFWDRLLGRREPKTSDPWGYTVSGCPVVQIYKRKGWKYWESGDTNHHPMVLEEMGLKNMSDLEGLRQYLLKLYPGAEVRIEE